MLLAAQPLCAQNGQPEPATTDIPDVPPSVNDYRLPPGTNTPAPANPAEGPVDEGSSAPVANTPVRPNEVPENLPVRLPAAGPGQAERADSPALSAPRSAPTAPRIEVPNAIFRERDNRAEEVDSIELPATQQPETKSQPEGLDIRPVPPGAAQEASGPWIKPLIGLAVLILLTGLGLFIWRRTRSGTALEVGKSNFVEVAVEPKPKHEIDSSRAKKVRKPPANGNITGKTVPTLLSRSNGSGTNPASRRSDGFIRIIFTAENVSTTLFNAVLGYQVALTNNSDTPLSDIKLQAVMAQAGSESVIDPPILPDEVLHHVQGILPGKTTILTGELRLPFNAIIPIQVNAQALLIPLAHFGIKYATEDGTVKHQSASYIIGREHQPRRAKMAPFRLDIGPHRFGSAGQRLL
ncbi:hypothetical protein MNBD_ALPHA04-7 [hydrothermal vent metagenome]|uniref:Uncharacterized protein n=1 Tax=hydrothermal vent metagenome TaxID=652676 RepID=A0A3B0T6K9_9ZZZZ